MKTLLDIQIVRLLAEWIWLVEDSNSDDSNDNDTAATSTMISPEICMGNFPWGLASGMCASRLLSKALGVAIILGAMVSKTPMIVNLLSSQHTAGLSKQSIYGEWLLCFNSAAYGWLSRHPFTSYGENVCLVAQSTIIVALLWQYDPQIGRVEMYMVGVSLLLYLVWLQMFLPEEWYHGLIAVGWPVMIYARGCQILEGFRAQHTGAQSGITLALNAVGATIRIFTTLNEVGWNVVLLCGFLLGLATNMTLLVQYLVYRENTKTFLNKLKQEREEKQKAKKE